MKKVTKKQEKQNFIDEYLKEYEPFSSVRQKNYLIKIATRIYNKKMLEDTTERYYDIIYQTPFGATSSRRTKGKSGRDAFNKYNYIDMQGNRNKLVSAKLSRNQTDEYKDGGNIKDINYEIGGL
jgi:hypothetical protein